MTGPTTEAGRAQHDLSWAAPTEYALAEGMTVEGHTSDRATCPACKAIAAIEAEARAEILDDLVAPPDPAIWEGLPPTREKGRWLDLASPEAERALTEALHNDDWGCCVAHDDINQDRQHIAAVALDRLRKAQS